MDLKSGIIDINGEIFSPGYTFDEFKNSSLYSGQNSLRFIRLKGIVKLLENNYIISLLFQNNALYMISLTCIDIELQFSEEIKRKRFHDSILEENGLDTESYFEWGNIKSVYDPKGNVSSINIAYNTGNKYLINND